MLIILKGQYFSNLKTFTSKPTNQGCVLHVLAVLGIWINKEFLCSKATIINKIIKTAITQISINILGLLAKDVGTYSNRLGSSMVMYLFNDHAYKIILIGR